jgi:hypothetical protein
MEQTIETSDTRQSAPVVATGRECGTCTLCCKVYDVPALNKPAGKWCNHCTPGKGCGIRETLPDHCRSFYCLYMTEAWLAPEWKPEVSKFVITVDPISRFMLVKVDPGQPKAWQKEPYLSQFRRWAQAMLPNGHLVIVFVNQHATIVSFDGMTELGIVGVNERIGTTMRITPNGPVYDITRTAHPV